MSEPDPIIDIKVVGLGAAGLRVMDKLAALGFPASRFLALETDGQELQRCQLADRMQLGQTTRRGWGCSGDAGEGAKSVRAVRDRIAGKLGGADLVVILAGLGGGMGGGGAAVAAEIAAEKGALVMAVMIEPFDLEGRSEPAALALQRVSQVADTVIRFPNQEVMDRQPKGASAQECLDTANNLILESLMGLGRLVRSDGLLNLDFGHVRRMIAGGHGESTVATVEVAGEARPRGVLDALMKHPFLRAGELLRTAPGVIVSLAGNEDLAMDEVDEFVGILKAAAPEAQLLVGVHLEPSLGSCLNAMMILPSSAVNPTLEEAHESIPGEPVPEPVIIAGVDAGLAQQQLPLVPVSKGRFDKGTPTLHAGEDLDVPTFLRRNIVLN